VRRRLRQDAPIHPAPWTRTGLPLVLAAAALAASGCAENNALSGSLTDFYDVSFDFVRARLYPSELAIEYARTNGEVPVRLTLAVGESALKPGTYELPAAGDISGRSGTTDIPAITSATVDLGEFSPVPGTAVVGSFYASFRTGDDVTSLTGDFDTHLVVIEHADGYDLGGYPPGASCEAPYPMRNGARFTTVIDENDHDAVGGGCFDGNDIILTFVLEERQRVELRPTFGNTVGATLQLGSCGFGEQVGCITGDIAQVVELEPGTYFLVVEGEGRFAVEIAW